MAMIGTAKPCNAKPHPEKPRPVTPLRGGVWKKGPYKSHREENPVERQKMKGGMEGRKDEREPAESALVNPSYND